MLQLRVDRQCRPAAELGARPGKDDVEQVEGRPSLRGGGLVEADKDGVTVASDVEDDAPPG